MVRIVSYEGYPLPNDLDANDSADDFVSFPTLPDPVVVANRSISTMISKTLRKVTNNASNLVHNYASPRTNEANDILDTLSVYSPVRDALPEPKGRSTAPDTDLPLVLSVGVSASPPPKEPSVLSYVPAPVPLVQPMSIPPAAEAAGPTAPKPVQVNTSTTNAPAVAAPPNAYVGSNYSAASSNFASPSSNFPALSFASSTAAPAVQREKAPISGILSRRATTENVVRPLPVMSPQIVGGEDAPRVTSDNRFLRISTMQLSKHAPSQLNRNEVTVHNTEGKPTKSEAGSAAQTPRAGSPDEDTTQDTMQILQVTNAKVSGARESLQNRITSIFNNLPNDIELSDDSASDLETIANDSLVSLTLHHKHQPPVDKPRQRKLSNDSVHPSHSPSVSSFYALKNKPLAAAPMARKISANFSSAFIDGAKSIINTNLAGVASSTTSIVDSFSEKKKKKKKRAHRLSDNPLKNGGIPKKYWMNDSFVSDCLNCFKPFSAFRRKHHCRFCGQIFCSECTIFISYTQYKQQRKEKDGKKAEVKSYNDKLRVCKPCYSDVIVYLSDDSLSSSEGEPENEAANTSDFFPIESDVHTNSENGTSIPDHPLNRFRSHSGSSRRNSIIAESPLLGGNRAFLNNITNKESPTLISSSPQHFDANLRSPEVLSHRHPPQMAIPTTRTGEAVEIPVSKSIFNAVTPQKSHLTLRTMKKITTPGLHSNSVGAKDAIEAKAWYGSYNHHTSPSVSSDIGRPSSLDNFGLLYKAVVNSRYGRISSASDKDFPTGVVRNPDNPENEQEEDVESENEDEQVMSLYTSLNHNDPSAPLSTLQHNTLSHSASRVPTLHEFPTMVINDKYVPANQNRALKRFEFKPIEMFHDASINENKQRSDYRSNERAKASLRRIRDRRAHKLTKNKFQVQGALRLPSIDTNFPQVQHSGASPASSPASPTPKPQSMIFHNRDFPTRSNSNLAVLTQKLISNSSTPELKNDEDKDTTHILQYSLEDHANTDYHRSYLADADLKDYIDTHKPTFSAAYESHIDKMIVQCLEDCDMKDAKEQERWLAVLKPALLNIHRLKEIDTLDVKQYIKIKKIPGGAIEDTSAVHGLLITKNIDSKRMQSVINNPKIALLVFPFEYLKQKEQFISLRIVNSQQSVYISNLVSRLISLEPDIVVVGDTVCGLAEKLLEEANITVISNVKPQVIERISRYTKGDIFQSVNDLFFKKGNLGSCGRFEVKRFVHKNVIKTYSFFVGSDIESGFTVCLRGGDEELLSSAKYAAESMIPGVFNSRFEKSLFQDSSLMIEGPLNDLESTVLHDLSESMKLDPEAPEDNESKLSCVKLLDQYGVFNYIKLFNERILSFSPSVQFSIPFALENVLQSFQKFSSFYEVDKKIQSMKIDDEVEGELLDKLQFHFNLERFNGKEDVINILKFVSERKLSSLMREFTFRIRLWSNCMKYTTYQLYPIFHKNIHFLHSMVSIKHATPCYGPIVVGVDYYTDNDKSLGLFLDQVWQESSKICDDCGESLLNHYKTYAHGNAKIDIVVELVADMPLHENFQGKNERIMWSFCPECNISTPITVMSDESYFLSLGKFFELCFWSQNAYYYKDCPHNYFKEHVKYFGYNNLVIRMEHSQIDTYEVVVPRKRLEFTDDTDIRLKIEAFELIQKSSNNFFQSISKRLNRVKVDTSDQAEEGNKRVEQLKEQLKSQQEFISAKTLQIYDSTLPTNYLSLNVIQRDIQELGVTWDCEFNDFEKEFLPSENEITKITQFHLRNFLMDKLDTEMKEPEDGSKEGSAGQSKSPDSHTSRALSSKQRTPGDEKHEAKEHPSIGSRMRVPLSIIEDKIMQIKQALESDQTMPLRSPSKIKADPSGEPNLADANNAPNRVQDLTNYFNQMTLEFQRQREEVLQNKSNNFKAIPIVNSRPIVEIYDNIEDMVDVDTREKHPSLNLNHADSGLSLAKLPDVNQSEEQSNLPGSLAIANRRLDVQNGMEQHRKSMGDGPLRAPRDLPKKLEIPQPERNSLLKSLTNFWADRSATLWDPLEYPLDFTEHTFADSDVIVREDEPSSLVAFCLSSNDYKQKIKDMGSNAVEVNSEEGTDNLENNEQFKKRYAHFVKIEKKFKKKIDKINETSELEITMTKTKSNHLKYQFLDGSTEMSCKIFYSEQFEAFRTACGVNDSFIQSLSRCVKWNLKGGKSGSNFLKTLDNRYIVKELSKSELESFVSIAPFYFKYIAQSTFNTLTTALAKIFGFYQVEIKNSLNAKTFKMDFLIMENLFYNKKTTRIFDLKGSMRNRHVKQTGKENEVLLDENMIEYIYESPVFVREQLKKLLRGSLFNDTSFLSVMDVMDYSLVIGIDDASRKLYVGIIDWLRTFTWDKKVENWVKGNSLVGKKGKDPTIVTPKQYRIRFREAMDRYILEVPDIWYEGNS